MPKTSSWVNKYILWPISVLCVVVCVGWCAAGYVCLNKAEYYKNEAIKYANEAAQLRAILLGLDSGDILAATGPKTNRHEFVFVVASDKTNTLAQKNNNYMNIKQLSNGGTWLGQRGVDKFGHVIFEDPAYSIRACAIVLKNYQEKHGIDTIKKLVNRFCTSNREPYARHLSKKLGVGVDEKIRLTDYMPQLLAGIAQFETGMVLAKEHYALLDLKDTRE